MWHVFSGVTNVFPKSKLAYSLGMHSVIKIEFHNQNGILLKFCDIIGVIVIIN